MALSQKSRGAFESSRSGSIRQSPSTTFYGFIRATLRRDRHFGNSRHRDSPLTANAHPLKARRNSQCASVLSSRTVMFRRASGCSVAIEPDRDVSKSQRRLCFKSAIEPHCEVSKGWRVDSTFRGFEENAFKGPRHQSDAPAVGH